MQKISAKLSVNSFSESIMTNCDLIKSLSTDDLAEIILNKDIENMVSDYFNIAVSDSPFFRYCTVLWLSAKIDEF